MKKIDKIDCCLHCPLKKIFGTYSNMGKRDYVCIHVATEDTIISDINILPFWCPLPEDDSHE